MAENDEAALVYSVPTLTACTTLSLLIHGWYNVHFGLSKLPLESHPRIMNILLSTPFIIWSLMFIAFLIDGSQNPALVHNFGLYCTFMSVMPGKVSSLFVIIITFSTIPIQASLALSLSGNFDTNDATSSISVQTLKMVIRVLIFSFLILIGFAEGIIHLLSSYRSWAVDLIMASLPVSAVLIFGIQRDFFETWARWSGIYLIPSFYSYLKSLFYPLLMQDRAQALVDTSQTQVTVTSDYTKSYL
ncbi:hypothetical protein VKT23_018564 [Stygiomarasmius scandens]|uniref:Uncharacterized protein n=1 Tax=Marasmiellus scandens TaxID=2682957 RepID=A0ABR1INR2_9AGAR